MPAVILAVLKYLFLLLIFLFLWRAVKAMYLEIGGPKAMRAQSGGGRTATVASRSKPGKPPDKLVVTSSDGARPKTYSIEDELIIGRDNKCHVVITDTYASQFHARVFRRDDAVFIEDMGSTNGTQLNRRKVSSPMPVNRGDTARIGKTQLEFKR